MSSTRVARNVSTAAVATIAAWSSWSHMVHVALRFGERPEVAYVLPISVDGMLVVASAAMVEDKRSGRDVRWSARIAFVVGVAASVAANIAAAQPTLGARTVAAWPAVALLLVVEMLSRTKPRAVGAVLAPTGGDAGTGSRGDSGANVMEAVHGGSDVDELPPTDRVPRVRDDPVPAGGPASPRPGSGPSRRGGRVAEAVARLRADRPDATPADIAVEVGVSERHVRRILTSAT